MKTIKKSYDMKLYDGRLAKLIIAIAKKKRTTTTKYIEEALSKQVEQDTSLLDKEELIKLFMK